MGNSLKLNGQKGLLKGKATSAKNFLPLVKRFAHCLCHNPQTNNIGCMAPQQKPADRAYLVH
jgi:hypothetical protein